VLASWSPTVASGALSAKFCHLALTSGHATCVKRCSGCRLLWIDNFIPHHIVAGLNESSIVSIKVDAKCSFDYSEAAQNLAVSFLN